MGWRVGVEIELMAPAGASRLDLAQALAAEVGGSVRRFFHPQSEPSKVPGSPVFQNLTPGFEVRDADGATLARCVDDLTLVEGLDRLEPPRDGWYRIVADDARLIRLIARVADPDAPLIESLRPVAALFGTDPEPGPRGMVRVGDETGTAVCVGAPLPGERDRPCELVTAPLDGDPGPVLDRLLGTARRLGFYAPVEGATHLHFDAGRLRSAAAVRSLVHLLHAHREGLRALVQTNPRCVRLGPWPDALLDVVAPRAFAELPWQDARLRLAATKPSKYRDVNLRNLVLEDRRKHTVEFRILPVYLETRQVLDAIALFEAVLHHALAHPIPARPPQPASALTMLLHELHVDDAVRERWLARAEALS